MNWNELETMDQLATIDAESATRPVFIFKHSTRCNISRMALDRLERNWNESEMGHLKPYFLDLISYRDISNQVAEQFDVEHESPQVLIIDKGQAVYDQSHMGIDYRAIRDVLKS